MDDRRALKLLEEEQNLIKRLMQIGEEKKRYCESCDKEFVENFKEIENILLKYGFHVSNELTDTYTFILYDEERERETIRIEFFKNNPSVINITDSLAQTFGDDFKISQLKEELSRILYEHYKKAMFDYTTHYNNRIVPIINELKGP